MESIYLRIFLTIVLGLTCVLLSSGHADSNRLTSRSATIEEPSEKPVLGREFKIKYAQQLTVEGQSLKVKFDSLLEDSRCPTDVKCIWAGDAKILISVTRANAADSKIELHTSPNFKQTGKYQRYVIKLVALDPYPRTRGKEKQSDYVATLLITRE